MVPTPRILGCPTSFGRARASATSAAMSTGVCVIRTATPPPTQVAFEYPRARRIRLRSPPYWAATSAAKPRTKAALAGSRSSSSGCVSVVVSFIVGAPGHCSGDAWSRGGRGGWRHLGAPHNARPPKRSSCTTERRMRDRGAAGAYGSGVDAMVHGGVDEGYGKVADEFRRNFTDRRELGASC